MKHLRQPSRVSCYLYRAAGQLRLRLSGNKKQCVYSKRKLDDMPSDDGHDRLDLLWNIPSCVLDLNSLATCFSYAIRARLHIRRHRRDAASVSLVRHDVRTVPAAPPVQTCGAALRHSGFRWHGGWRGRRHGVSLFNHLFIC